MRKLIADAYEVILEFLAVLSIIGFTIYGYFFGGHLYLLSKIYSFLANKDPQIIIYFRIIGILIGLLVGIIVTVITFGFLFQISSIRKDLEQLKNHLSYSEAFRNISDHETEE